MVNYSTIKPSRTELIRLNSFSVNVPSVCYIIFYIICYIMQLYIQRLKSAYCLKFFKFLSYGSKWDKLGRFQNCYRKYKSLNLQAYLAGAKQPHNFHGKGESCYVFKSLTAIWQFTSVLTPVGRSFPWQLRRQSWINPFERSTNQPLFPAVFFPLNTRNTFDIRFLLLSSDEIMWLLARLHISTREVL